MSTILSRSLGSSGTPLRRLASTSTAQQLPKKISKAEESADKKKLNIAWEDGTRGSVPLAWLRDSATESKIMHVSELSMEVRPEAISVTESGSEVRIQWPPYDVSRYSTQFLFDHTHSQPAGVPLAASNASVWAKGFVIPEVSNDLAAEAGKLRSAWEEFGVVVVKAGHNLAEGDFLHLLGLEKLEPVTSSEKSLAKAYPMSTHHPELDAVPRVHTVKALRTGQGNFMVADGFYVAQQFQAGHPELFEFAAGRGISYEHEGLAKTASRPLFSLRAGDGRLASVCFNNPLRCRDVLLPQRAQDLLYKSMQTFNKIAMAAYVDVPMSQGDILVVDNSRVLTGNASFAPHEDGTKPLFRLSTFGHK